MHLVDHASVRSALILVLGALLALSGCTSSNLKEERIRLKAENERLRAMPTVDPQTERKLREAEDTLATLRGLLANAQASLDPGAPAEQRQEARRAVAGAQDNLAEVRMVLETQPDSPAKAVTDEALDAVGQALVAVDEALNASGTMASAGLIAFADMHTSLDRAQAALDDAQAKLRTALAADPDPTLRNLLSQAQATLSTAQISLLPLLREELDEALAARRAAETERGTAQAARQAAEDERDEARGERDEAQAARRAAETERGTAQAARQAAEDERDEARGERDEAQAARRAAEGERDTAQAEVDRLTLPFGKDLEIGGREASRTSPADDAKVTLTARRSGVEWTATTGFDATSPTWGIRTRYTVENYGTAGADRLAIARDPVPWGADAGMVIPGAAGAPATNEFPGRGEVFRGIGYDHDEFTLPRQGSYGPASDGTAAAAIPRYPPPSGRTGLRGNLKGHAISSFQYREEGGFTMNFGALPPDRKPDDAHEESKGSLIYGDLEALTATGRYDCGPDGDEACDEAGTRDLTVSFGAPSRDPLGDPAYYWTVDVPDPRLTIAVGTTASLDAASRADPDGVIGRYEMLLANHAGVDDKGTADEGDDGERYLRYAAYGLFQFVDFQTTSARPGRMQTFHYGFDAFGDHNPLPDASADSVAATFNGRTMAWLATTHGGGVISGLDRMRGNVTLHACIGGGGCQDGDFTAPAGAAKPTDANKLTGAIHDLEIALPGGAWGHGNTSAHRNGYYAFSGDVLLDGDVGAGGAFSGTARPDTAVSDSERSAGDSGTRTAGADTHGYTIRQQVGGNSGVSMSEFWKAGRFEGAFYGPADGLEAAGSWWLPPVGAEVTTSGVLGIIGSFGAKCAEGCD